MDPVTGVSHRLVPPPPPLPPLGPANEGAAMRMAPPPPGQASGVEVDALLGRGSPMAPPPGRAQLLAHHVAYWRQLRRWHRIGYHLRVARHAPRLTALGLVGVPTAEEVMAAAEAAATAAAAASPIDRKSVV